QRHQLAGVLTQRSIYSQRTIQAALLISAAFLCIISPCGKQTLQFTGHLPAATPALMDLLHQRTSASGSIKPVHACSLRQQYKTHP
ncbi:hypothetical protein, partial [Xanthomonas pisi]|uniref:hypothetical protein n=1 Tax=Xanthomonas pisi TaxID=56457 RepID=UPI001B800095